MSTTPGVPPPVTSHRDPPVAKRRKLSTLRRRTEDDPRKRKTYRLLYESIAVTRINNVPIFHTADGDIVDGNTRHCVMEDLGIDEAVCMELPADWTKADIIQFAIGTDGVRRILPLVELGGKTAEYMRLTGSTQEQAARALGISPSHLCRALACLLLPAKHADKATVLKDSVKALIASEGEVAVQDALMEIATTPGPDGKLPSRDAVVLQRKRLKGEKKRGRKPKSLAGKFEGRAFSLELRSDDAPFMLAEWLKQLSAKVAKAGQDMPVDGLPFIFR